MENIIYEQNTNEELSTDNLSIGTVAKILGCNRSLLRYYEEQFEIDVPRSISNRRYYTHVELEKFRYILKLKDSGLTNTEIKSVLSSERVNRTEYEFLTIPAPEENEQTGEKAPSSASDELSGLYEMIANLRDEINELKNMGAVMEKSELIKENNILKQKLKEKTYELVSLREERQPKKRGFFR
ncbi:MAG: MerR family transcriptional regulator [Eubacteriaceae bacterium]|nr:MerR family transcriptional regulator [Eubacteriaceae bacterium]